jgi:hypothetical protein
MEETAEQINNKPWLYKKGQSGNPSGRPKGSISMKTWIKNRLETMTDDEREEFMEGLPKEVIWKMAEGNPKQDTDVTSGGKELQPILVKFIDAKDNRDTN